MKSLLKFSLLVFALSLAAPLTAHAFDRDNRDGHKDHNEGDYLAPEVDPTLAVSAIALLAGCLTVASARRSKA